MPLWGCFLIFLQAQEPRVPKELLPPVAPHDGLALVCDQAGELTQTDSLENKSQAEPGGGGGVGGAGDTPTSFLSVTYCCVCAA